MTHLPGQVALITGVGSFTGREQAILLARQGFSVAVTDVNAERARSVASEINYFGGAAQALPADLTEAAEATALVAAVTSLYGRLDSISCNPPESDTGVPEGFQIDFFRRTFDGQVLTALNVSHAAMEVMKGQGQGHILLVTPRAGSYGRFGQITEQAAVMGIRSLVRSLTTEGAAHGVRVSCLSPAPHEKDLSLLALRVTEEICAPSGQPLPGQLSQGAPHPAGLCRTGSPHRRGLRVLHGGYTEAVTLPPREASQSPKLRVIDPGRH